jgi:citrate/tricarballylate utilization protein
MIDVRLLAEADRHLTVCNACRYCEGLCPVFVAMERRRVFGEGDIVHLANLCHDCRACFDACPFSPPHELAINVPSVMAEVREQTYRAYTFPQLLSRAFRDGTRTALVVTVLSIVAILAVLVAWRPAELVGTFTGPGAFYEVIPWLAMVIPAMLVSLYGLVVLAVGVYRFWRDTDGPLSARLDVRSLVAATADVLLLREMRGGGPGCTYPDGEPTHRRVVLHQLLFYGFGLTFLSTALAALAQDVLDVLPPYPILSPIVLTGTVGGLMQVVGAGGLIALKLRAPEIPASVVMRRLDFAFLVLLVAANVTGLALLALRDTPALGTLLVIHLGTIGGLFITLPYGKFVHVIYRYAALVRNHREEQLEGLTVQIDQSAG